MAFKNDMTMMYAMHAALRRELDRIARVTARTDDDPQHVLRTAAGWQMFDAMEAEHSAIDPLLAAIDAALADRDSGPHRVGELTDALASALRAHLDHEEAEGLTLIDATVTEEQFQAFGTEHGKRIGGDAQRYLPWMLDGATPEVTATVLDRFPAPLQQAYRDQWQPATPG